MKKILILSWRGPKHPLAGGAELVTHMHAKAWVAAGFDVTLFTSSAKGLQRQEVIDGVRIIRKGNQVLGVHAAAVYWYLFSPDSYDLVIDQFHGIPFFTPLYARTKKIAFIHEVTREVWALNPWRFPFNYIPFVFGWLFEPLIFQLLYRNIKFITVSKSTKRDLKEWGIKDIRVINNGFDRPQKVVSKSKVPTFIYLGALTKDKGVADAIKVFTRLAGKYLNWQFFVVGKGDTEYVSELKNKTKELGDRIKFFGYVGNAKKFELLGKAWFLINPSIREGWGLVNIESSSCATPVLGYKVPGMVDSVKRGVNGYLVKQGDTERLAEIAVRLVKDKKAYKTLCLSAKNFASNFSWKSSTAESTKFLKDYLG